MLILYQRIIYEPFTIGAIHKGETIGYLSRVLGYTEGYVGAGLWIELSFTEGMSFAELAPVGGSIVGLAGGLLAIGYTAETDIPDSKYYLTSSVPIDSINIYQLLHQISMT